MTTAVSPARATPSPAVPTRAAWFLPATMAVISALALLYAAADPANVELALFVPGTFLGNSLAPVPYDGMVVYLGDRYPIWLVVLLGVMATVVIEEWNMELLARILARDGTRGFRGHRLTRWMLRVYQKAPFWSLVGTCVLPIVPHYPMRVLAVLARYPMWKYQVSVIVGRGGRYLWLAALGWAFHIPGKWIAIASIVALLLAVRGARRMNREPGELDEVTHHNAESERTAAGDTLAEPA